MTPHWIGLALLCAFALASADAASKAWLQELSAPELVVVRFGITGLLMSPLLLGLPPLDTLPLTFWGWIGAAVPLEIAAMLLYMTAIRDHPLSLTLPYLAFTPVFVIAVAWALLGERITGSGAAGIGLVVLGAWLLNSDQARLRHWRDWPGWMRPFRAMLRERGARLMLGVASIYALTATLGKGAMQYLAPEQFGAFFFGVLGLTASLIFVLPNPRILRHLGRRLWPVLTVGALIALMVYTHFLALRQVETAYMIAVKRTSLLFGMLYGALIFHEPDLARRLPAGLVMVGGVGLILWRGA